MLYHPIILMAASVCPGFDATAKNYDLPDLLPFN